MNIIIILRAGLVESANNTFNDNNTKLKSFNETSTPSKTSQINRNDSIVVDKCAEFGEINLCTQQHPYCFVNGDDLRCRSTSSMGWRISPLDGLILINGRRPNANCELFNPPKQPEIQNIVINLLNESEIGLVYKGRESAWHNIFDYLGNCPLKSQFCDRDLLICKDLFGAGTNCNSSNQCFSRYCDVSAPDNITERLCVENDTTEGSSRETKEDTAKRDRMLLIIISLSVGFPILTLVLIIFLINAQRKEFKIPLANSSNNSINPNPLLPSTKHLSALQSNSFSKNTTDNNRDTFSSDNFSVLLPPPPTISRDVSSLYINPRHTYNYYRSNISQDSFDIYPPPSFQHETIYI